MKHGNGMMQNVIKILSVFIFLNVNAEAKKKSKIQLPVIIKK